MAPVPGHLKGGGGGKRFIKKLKIMKTFLTTLFSSWYSDFDQIRDCT